MSLSRVIPDVATAAVDEQRRVRLPPEVEAELEWLRKSEGRPIECILLVNSKGGVQVAPIDSHFAEKLRSDLQKIPPKPRFDESEAESTDLLRLDSATWRVTLNVDKNHYRIAIPVVVGHLGLLNLTKGSRLAIFAAGEILELWDSDKYRDHVRGIAGTLTDRIARIEAP